MKGPRASLFGTKVCPKCKREQAEEQFSKAKARPDGLAPWCRSCARDYQQHRYKTHPELYRDSKFRQLYGITLAEYEVLLVEQNGGCAVCGGTCATGRRLAVDHDHDTGKVRGLLCVSCNTSLGAAGDNADRLRDLARYLDERR